MCVYVRGAGAMPSVDKWRFKHINELAELEGFINSIRAESAELMRKFSFEMFTAFYISLV